MSLREITVTSDTIVSIGLEAYEIVTNTVWQYYLDSLFSGKQKEHNRGVLRELLLHGEMTHYQLARRVFGGKYSSAHDRVTALKNRTLLQMKGERPGTRNKQPTALWGLSPLGFWVAVHEFDEGKAKFRPLIEDYWKTFTEVYRLDKVETEEPLYTLFTKWLKSDQGMVKVLDDFGHAAFANKGYALITFRRMVDIGLLTVLVGRAFAFYESDRSVAGRDPYQALGEIAVRHELFGKLYAAFRETDALIQPQINKVLYEEIHEKLPTIPEHLAKQLAVTPFYRYLSTMQNAGVFRCIAEKSLPEALAEIKSILADHTDEDMTEEDMNLLFTVSISHIVINGDRVCLVTEDLERIDSLWRDNFDVYWVTRQGKQMKVEIHRAGGRVD